MSRDVGAALTFEYADRFEDHIPLAELYLTDIRIGGDVLGGALPLSDQVDPAPVLTGNVAVISA